MATITIWTAADFLRDAVAPFDDLIETSQRLVDILLSENPDYARAIRVAETLKGAISEARCASEMEVKDDDDE